MALVPHPLTRTPEIHRPQSFFCDFQLEAVVWPAVYASVYVAPRGTLGCPRGIHLLRVNPSNTHAPGAVSGFRGGPDWSSGSPLHLASDDLNWARVLVLSSEAGRELWWVLLVTHGAKQGGGTRVPGGQRGP